MTFPRFSYQTSRLQINEILNSNQNPDFLASVMQILTASVVENLPPYFHNVDSTLSAQ